MADNRTLDEFGTSERDDSDVGREVDATRPGSIDDSETPGDVAVDEAVENRSASIESTVYRWDPDGTCAACGESSSRLWRDGEEFVCPSCKRWSG